jgi:serine/threonine protein kinase
MSYDIGSFLYMSPQQKLTGFYTTKTDVYALGVIYFEMLNGIGKTPVDLDCTDYKTRVTDHKAVEKALREIKVSYNSINFINGCLKF